MAKKKVLKLNNKCDEKTNLSKINTFKVTVIFTLDILIRIFALFKNPGSRTALTHCGSATLLLAIREPCHRHTKALFVLR